MRVLLLGLLVALLAGCGFHLRGTDLTSNLVASKVQVVGGGGTAQQLRRALQNAPGVALIDTPETGALQIDIQQEGSQQQVLTLNSLGRVGEYRLYYTVQFRARQNNDTVLESSVLSLYRDYTYDDSNVLGKDNEANTLIANMQQDAALQVLRRVNTAMRNARAASAPSDAR